MKINFTHKICIHIHIHVLTITNFEKSGNIGHLLSAIRGSSGSESGTDIGTTARRELKSTS